MASRVGQVAQVRQKQAEGYGWVASRVGQVAQVRQKQAEGYGWEASRVGQVAQVRQKQAVRGCTPKGYRSWYGCVAKSV